MKLISMTDFVLMEGKGIKKFKYTAEQIRSYAKFLKQPLKLEMFVPCDDEGSVLENPICQLELEQYRKAKEKVLFEGCSTMQQGENTIVIFKDTAIWLTWTNRIVEDLLKDRVILTQNAIKQFM